MGRNLSVLGRFRERLCRYCGTFYVVEVSGGSPTGNNCGPSSIDGFLVHVLFILIPISASTLVSKGGAVCGNSARTDLCGGCSAMAIPTAIPLRNRHAQALMVLLSPVFSRTIPQIAEHAIKIQNTHLASRRSTDCRFPDISRILKMKHTKTPLRFASFLFAVLCAGQTAGAIQSTYILGPDDQINVIASDIEELSGKAPVRIDMRRFIKLPMAGRIQAGGMTPEQLEAEVGARLKKYMQHPEVQVSVTEFRSQPVSVLGAVTTPGVQQFQGRKTLFEVISMAGGIEARCWV